MLSIQVGLCWGHYYKLLQKFACVSRLKQLFNRYKFKVNYM